MAGGGTLLTSLGAASRPFAGPSRLAIGSQTRTAAPPHLFQLGSASHTRSRHPQSQHVQRRSLSFTSASSVNTKWKERMGWSALASAPITVMTPSGEVPADIVAPGYLSPITSTIADILLSSPLPSFGLTIILFAVIMRSSTTLPITLWQRKRLKAERATVEPLIQEYNEKVAKELAQEAQRNRLPYEEYKQQVHKKVMDYVKSLEKENRTRQLITRFAPLGVHIPVLILASLSVRQAMETAGTAITSESFMWIAKLGEIDPALGVVGMIMIIANAERMSSMTEAAKSRKKRTASASASQNPKSSGLHIAPPPWAPALPKHAASPPPGPPPETSTGPPPRSSPSPPPPPQQTQPVRKQPPPGALSLVSPRSPGPAITRKPYSTLFPTKSSSPHQFSTNESPLSSPTAPLSSQRSLSTFTPLAAAQSPPAPRGGPQLEDANIGETPNAALQRNVLSDLFSTYLPWAIRLSSFGFLFFSLNAPSGLVLYWVTSIIYTFCQGLVFDLLAKRDRVARKSPSAATLAAKR